MFNKYFPFFFTIILAISCSSPNGPEVSNTNTELFPLRIGNYWKYEEEFISNDTSYSNYKVEYTTTIVKKEKIGKFNWYKLESSRTDWREKRYLTTENDSVFELQYNWSNPVRVLEYIIPTKREEKFRTIMGGDVVITKTVQSLDSVISTKAGNFKNCLMFEYSSPDVIEREILAFGVGVIEKQIIGFDFTTGKQIFSRIIRIIDYKIN